MPQQPGDPFIEKPTAVKVDDTGQGLTHCWLDPTQYCTGACEAYDPVKATDESRRFTKCRLINLGLAIGSVLIAEHQFHQNSPPNNDIEPPKVY